MPCRRPSTFRLGYAAKLSLAAMTLLLPLVVFMVILVHDRDAQIRVAESEIAGLETLVDMRHLLELVLQHHALAESSHESQLLHSAGVEAIEAHTDAAFTALVAASAAAPAASASELHERGGGGALR